MIRILQFIFLFWGITLSARTHLDPINIWDGTDCSAKVRLTPYIAEGSNNIGCIVCPGGSYFWLDKQTEGVDVAEWLRKNGISAFVLEYRVAGVAAFITHYRYMSRGNRFPDMLQDVQRSIEILRENASFYGLDPNKIGVMGFSAGGHLSIMSGEFFGTNSLSEFGLTPKVSLRPDFIAPIYPVVSFTDKSAHKRSLRGILGEGSDVTDVMKDSLSLEKHVYAEMPPVFLMNCVDDPVVNYRNSELLDSALTSLGVVHEYIQFKTGGHGFGVSSGKTTAEAIMWKEIFIKWVKDIFQ